MAASCSMTLEEIVLQLYDVQGIKFGDFVVRTGEHSPVYIDMRVIWSYPKLVKAVSEHMWEMVREKRADFTTICGIPYQGIPLATALSIKHEIPMLLKRKVPKTYGTCQAMEGHYQPGDRVVLVDDVLMTGGTFLQDIPFFQAENLVVPFGVAFFDREQGGSNRVKKLFGIDVHCVLSLSKAFEVLLAHGKVTQDVADNTMAYLRDNRFDTPEHLVLPSQQKKDDSTTN